MVVGLMATGELDWKGMARPGTGRKAASHSPASARAEARVEALEGRVMLSVARYPEYRGVNALDVYNPYGCVTDARPWGVEIIREGVFEFDQAIFGYGYNAAKNLHGLQGVVDGNAAEGVITILCPFSWRGAQVLGNIPSRTSYWASYKTQLAAMATQFKGQPNVWIEVWNEPYDWATATDANQWLSDMKAMVTAIRDTGATNKIVIPGGQMGGSELPIVAKGQALVQYDPQHNIMFDLHAYNAWYDSGLAGMEARIDSVLDSGNQMIFGEFGAGTPGGMYDISPFLQAVESRHVGALAWSWNYGDGSALLNGDGTFSNTADNYNAASQVFNYLLDAKGALPAGWTDGDVGSPSLAGKAGYGNGRFVLNGGGSDIWNGADQFNYAYRTVSGDQVIVARVGVQQNTDGWAKAGVMFRESTAAGAKFAAVEMTPGNGIRLQARTATGAAAIDVASAGGATPTWFKLIRSGGTCTAYYATTSGTPAATDWVRVGSVDVNLGNGGYLAGLAATSHDVGEVGIAAFSDVSIVAAPAVSSRQVNDGSAQRSMVRGITYTFSSAVTVSSTAFALMRRGDGLVVPMTSTSSDGRTYLLGFGGSSLVGGSLADGVYDLVLHVDQVTDAYGQVVPGADQTFSFLRLYGDYDGNGTVNNADYFQFKKAFGLSSSDAGFKELFDYDGNGTLNNADYFQFKKRFGVVLSL